jgi:hypothetical protein
MGLFYNVLKHKRKIRVQKLGSAEKIFASNPLRHIIQKMDTDLSTIIVDKIGVHNMVAVEVKCDFASKTRPAVQSWSILARFFPRIGENQAKQRIDFPDG